MAVLITGGAGFVGSHLAERLVGTGEHVVACDDLSTGRLAHLTHVLETGRLTFVYLDVTAPLDVIQQTVRAATRDRFTAIFHLAGDVGTQSMIDFAHEMRSRLVFTATSEAPEHAIDDRMVRIVNGYGPRMSLADDGYLAALLVAAREKRPFPIRGTGLQMHSLIYVDDVIDGLLAVARASQPVPEPIELGSDDEIGAVELARAIADIAGVPFLTDPQPARTDEARRRTANLTRARSLGWRPRTALRRGLSRTFAWTLHEALQYA